MADKKNIAKKRVAYWIIYLMNFFWAGAFALPMYIQSSFIESIVGIEFAGLVFFISTVVMLLFMLILPNFLQKFHNFKVTIAINLLAFLSSILIYFSHGLLSVLFYILYVALLTVLVICFDIFLEQSIASEEETGRVRTIKLWFINVVVLVSPLLSGYLLSWFDSYRLVYLLSGLFFIMVVILMLFSRNQLDDRTVSYKKRSLKSIEKIFKTHPNITRSVKIEFALRFFYAVMVLYMPIYLHDNIGFSWPQIGLVFTIMLIPFVTLQIPAGRIADKYIGEKEMIIGGMIFIVTFTLWAVFTNTHSVWQWALILFMTRVGAAVLEAMNEVFFFKHVDEKDIDLIDVFRDIRPIGWLVASFVAFVILFIWSTSIKVVILFAALIVFYNLRQAIFIKDTK